jgi:hypothetical protein
VADQKNKKIKWRGEPRGSKGKTPLEDGGGPIAILAVGAKGQVKVAGVVKCNGCRQREWAGGKTKVGCGMIEKRIADRE